MQSAPTATKNYWFFLSYAGRDAIGHKFLRKFYEELALEVGRAAGLPSKVTAGEIGFFDETGIEAGEAWSATLTEALQTSRVFICLYSPSYFNSDNCGKELQLFRSRVDAWVAASPPGPRPPLIIPILWQSAEHLPKLLPEALAEIQYTHAEFGAVYAKEGLYRLRSLRKYKDSYREFLMAFADRLTEVATQYEVPRLQTIPSFAEARSAFQQTINAGAPSGVSSNGQAGPRFAHFVYVAGRDVDLRGVRSRLDFYGPEGGRDWRPYHPEIPKPVGMITQGVATSENLFYEPLPLGEDLIQHLRKAESANSIVIILVDPWSIKVQSYRRQMMSYDENMFKNCGVLVPWNERDEETSQQLISLKDNLGSTFSRNYIVNREYINDKVKSAEELEMELVRMIGSIRKRIFKVARASRPVVNTQAPTLLG
jgi:FxsC-like protein